MAGMANNIDRPEGLTITKFEQVGPRQFTARVTLDGVTVDVEYVDGSWKQVVREAPRVQRFRRKEVPVSVAAALQQKMPAELRMRACERPKKKLRAEDLVSEHGYVKVDALATGQAVLG